MKVTRKIKQVRASDLIIDSRVQRDYRPAKARKIAENFDPAKLGVIAISQRPNGDLIVIDGQHRAQAAQDAGYKGTITAVIYMGLSLRDEADMFLGYNDASPVRTLDKLRVRVTAGDSDAEDIAATLLIHGFGFQREPDLRRVDAAGAVEKAYRLGGKRILGRTFATIAAAWPSDENAAHGVIILSLAEFYLRFPDSDTERVAHLISADRPLTLVGDIKSMKSIERLRTLDEAGVRILMNAYNRGLRGERRLRVVS